MANIKNDFYTIMGTCLQQNKYNGMDDAKAKLFAMYSAVVAWYETGNFSNNAFMSAKNPFSYGYYPSSPYQTGNKLKVNDDVGNVGVFKSVDDCCREFCDWINRGDREIEFNYVKTFADFVTAMKACGYFTDNLKNYFDGCKSCPITPQIMGTVGFYWGSLLPGKTALATIIAPVSKALNVSASIAFSIVTIILLILFNPFKWKLFK